MAYVETAAITAKGVESVIQIILDDKLNKIKKSCWSCHSSFGLLSKKHECHSCLFLFCEDCFQKEEKLCTQCFEKRKVVAVESPSRAEQVKDLELKIHALLEEKATLSSLGKEDDAVKLFEQINVLQEKLTILADRAH